MASLFAGQGIKKLLPQRKTAAPGSEDPNKQARTDRPKQPGRRVNTALRQYNG